MIQKQTYGESLVVPSEIELGLFSFPVKDTNNFFISIRSTIHSTYSARKSLITDQCIKLMNLMPLSEEEGVKLFQPQQDELIKETVHLIMSYKEVF